MQLSLGCILRRRELSCQCMSLLLICYTPNPSLSTLIHFFPPIFPFRAYVVPKGKLQPGEDPMVFSKEIQKWVRSRVANHQYLRGGVVIIDEIPKNGSGKVLRGELHDQAKGLRSGLQMTKV